MLNIEGLLVCGLIILWSNLYDLFFVIVGLIVVSIKIFLIFGFLVNLIVILLVIEWVKMWMCFDLMFFKIVLVSLI